MNEMVKPPEWNGWDEGKVDQLKRLCQSGDKRTMAKIAAELGCTRGAVIGKIGRLRLQGQDPYGRPAAAEPEPEPPAVAVVPPPKVEVDDPPPPKVKVAAARPPVPEEGVDIMALQQCMCRFPLWDKASDQNKRYCGRRTANVRLSWCEEHLAVVVDPRLKMPRTRPR